MCFYCNEACQRAHWQAAHRRECKALAVEVVRRLEAEAARGSADALHDLGLQYVRGRGVERDAAKGAALVERAAAMMGGDNAGTALFNAASLAEKAGRMADALRLLHEAAEAGSANAMHNLGVKYATGAGVAADNATAVRWVRAAAEGGFPNAMTNLANRLREGRGVTQDLAAALSWYRKASASGDDEGGVAAGAAGSLLLGSVGRSVGIFTPELMAGVPLLPSDPAAALDFFKLSAARGSAGSAHCAAMMRMIGAAGVERSAEWIPLLRRAIALGSTQSQQFLDANGLELREGVDDQAFAKTGGKGALLR